MSAPRARRRRWPIVVTVVVVALLAWLAWVAVSIAAAAGDARDGVDSLEQVEGLDSGGTSGLLDSTVGEDGDAEATAARTASDLRSAAEDFDSAGGRLSGPLMAPAAHLPVVGRQVDSVKALSSSAETVAASSADAFDELGEILGMEVSDPSQRAAAVGEVGLTLDVLRSEIVDLDLGPKANLVGPLARARDDFSERLVVLEDTLDDAVPAAIGLGAFLEGPSNYLFFSANNAEMRAGSGMFLQAAPMVVNDGRFDFGEFVATDSLVLDAPGTTLDPDVANLWGWLSPDRDFRNVNLTTRFQESARMSAEMWAAGGHPAVDGVLAVDVVALQRLLEVVGPVEVPASEGGAPLTISADNVAAELLLAQYQQFTGERDDRRDELGRVATAVLGALNDREVTPADLLDAFIDTGAGRHLLAWSPDPQQQAAWEALGASGEPAANSLGVMLANRGGDKLDQFMDVTVEADFGPVDDEKGTRRVELVVNLANNAPDGLPTYVQGPYPGSIYPGGTYQGFLDFTLPQGSVVAGIDPADTAVAATGPDGPTQTQSYWIDLDRGAREQLRLSVDLPESVTEVELLPSARSRPVPWTVDGEQTDDKRPRDLTLPT